MQENWALRSPSPIFFQSHFCYFLVLDENINVLRTRTLNVFCEFKTCVFQCRKISNQIVENVFPFCVYAPLFVENGRYKDEVYKSSRGAQKDVVAVFLWCLSLT